MNAAFPQGRKAIPKTLPLHRFTCCGHIQGDLPDIISRTKSVLVRAFAFGVDKAIAFALMYPYLLLSKYIRSVYTDGKRQVRSI